MYRGCSALHSNGCANVRTVQYMYYSCARPLAFAHVLARHHLALVVGELPPTVSSLVATKQQAGDLPVVITEWSSSWMYTIQYVSPPDRAPNKRAAQSADIAPVSGPMNEKLVNWGQVSR